MFSKLRDTILPKENLKRYAIKRSMAFPGRWLLWDRNVLMHIYYGNTLEEVHNYIMEHELDGQVEEYREG